MYVYVHTNYVLTNTPIPSLSCNHMGNLHKFFFYIAREGTQVSPLLMSCNFIFIFPSLYMGFFYTIFFYFSLCDYIEKDKYI
jgi:hypothetical protein